MKDSDHHNLLGGGGGNTKRTHDTVTDASKDVDVEVNTEKTKYMLTSHHQNAGQNQYVKTANRSFENVTKLK
jgi:hypothetical protein